MLNSDGGAKDLIEALVQSTVCRIDSNYILFENIIDEDSSTKIKTGSAKTEWIFALALDGCRKDSGFVREQSLKEMYKTTIGTDDMVQIAALQNWVKGSRNHKHSQVGHHRGEGVTGL